MRHHWEPSIRHLERLGAAGSVERCPGCGVWREGRALRGPWRYYRVTLLGTESPLPLLGRECQPPEIHPGAP